MQHNLKELYGHKLAAIDGDIGHVKDFYFDDQTWVIRYLVADTGTWLPGRLVLLSPHAFGPLDEGAKTLRVNLSRKQIEDSPSPELHKPVSRQYEIEFYRYYGWPAYWNGGAMWGLGDVPLIMPPAEPAGKSRRTIRHRDDKHLQSTHAVNGYNIQAVDGAIGQVSGFLVDDKNWAIRRLVVETGHWYAGKEIQVAPGKVERISYPESTVYLTLTMAEIERTGKGKLAKAGASGR